MVRKLSALLEKEVKDLLRDPRIYIGLVLPLLIFPIMNSIAATTIVPAIQGSQNLNIALIDEDQSRLSLTVREFLENYGLTVHEFAPDQKDRVMSSTDLDALIIIPKGFEEAIESFQKAGVKILFFVRRLDMMESVKLSGIEQAIGSLNDYFSTNIIMEMGNVDPNFVKSPLTVKEDTVLKGSTLNLPPSALFSQMFAQSFLIPFIILMLSIVVAQIAATSTAVENEEKTLETLLTLPVDRASILMAKLLASTIIAAIGTLFYLIGFQFYLTGFMGGMLGNVMSVNLGAGNPVLFVLLGVSLLLAILFTTSVGVMIGALSNDVRIANSLLGVLIIPIMIPAFVLMFGGSVQNLPFAFKVMLLSLPTTYPMILSKSMLLGEIPIEGLYGLPYSLIVTLAVIYITGKLLEPEKLFRLQHRIIFRRRLRK